MADEERATRHPQRMPSCKDVFSGSIVSIQSMTASIVRPIWSVPPRNTGLLSLFNESPESSMPMVNISMAMPISAISLTACWSETRPQAFGPKMAPVSRKPTIAGNFRRLQTRLTAIERRKRMTISSNIPPMAYTPDGNFCVLEIENERKSDML